MDNKATILPGLGGLIKKVEFIQAECGEKNPEEGTKKEKKDDFLEMKGQMLSVLQVIRNTVRERAQIQKKYGNNYQVIDKTAKIREQIAKVDQLMPKLAQIQMRQAKSRKFDEQEKEARKEDIRLLTKQLEECRMAIQTNRELESDDEEEDFQNFERNGEFENGARNRTELLINSFEVDKTGRAMTQAEEDAVKKWKDRDKQFDEMLDQIGTVCDRLNPLVAQIGEAAQRQDQQAQHLQNRVEKHENTLQSMSKKALHIMKQEKGTSFICKITLFVVLFIVLGVIVRRIAWTIAKNNNIAKNNRIIQTTSQLLYMRRPDVLDAKIWCCWTSIIG